MGSNHALLPRVRMEQCLRSAIALAPLQLFPLVNKGAIKTHQTELAGFKENGIVLKNGEFIEVDLLICSTGFYSDLNILPQYKHLIDESSGIQLYRHIIHPDIPDLAFAGFNCNFLHLPMQQIGMIWLLAVLNGDIKLPSREDQLAEIEKMKKWKRDNLLYEPCQGAIVGTKVFSYIDEILGDLHVNPNRKSNLFLEWMAPYSCSDLSRVIQESKDYFSKQRKKLKST